MLTSAIIENCIPIIFNFYIEVPNSTEVMLVMQTLPLDGGTIGLILKTIGDQMVKLYLINGALNRPIMKSEMELKIFIHQEFQVPQDLLPTRYGLQEWFKIKSGLKT